MISLSRHHQTRISIPTGFTLIELILVIGILVMIVSLAMPMVTRTMGRQSLQTGGDRVRIAMGQARVEAIRSGEIQALFYQPGSNWFNVAKFSSFANQATLAANEQQRLINEGYSPYEDRVLPKGVRFVDGIATQDARSFDTMGEESAGGAIRPILFYPDGTAQDARLLLQDTKGDAVEVALRGLSGMAKMMKRQAR